MSELIVYTDGGCSGNPGYGGWAYIIRNGTEFIKGSGGDEFSTNNRMELLAVIRSLEFIRGSVKNFQKVIIHTDSQYVQKGISEWIFSWEKRGWKTAGGGKVKNRDLWERLLELSRGMPVEWIWIKGHDGIEMNESCDRMVRDEIRKLQKHMP